MRHSADGWLYSFGLFEKNDSVLIVMICENRFALSIQKVPKWSPCAIQPLAHWFRGSNQGAIISNGLVVSMWMIVCDKSWCKRTNCPNSSIRIRMKKKMKDSDWCQCYRVVCESYFKPNCSTVSKISKVSENEKLFATWHDVFSKFQIQEEKQDAHHESVRFPPVNIRSCERHPIRLLQPIERSKQSQLWLIIGLLKLTRGSFPSNISSLLH